MTSSWIKLDQSFSKSVQMRNSRNKRIHREAVNVNISDIEDDSSQENYPSDSNPLPVKIRKMKPLENVTINHRGDNSDDSCEVEYNPDGTQLNITGAKSKFKALLPFSVSATKSRPLSVSATMSRRLSTSIPTNTSKLHSWSTWTTFPKTTEDINLSNSIDDSTTDSDESSAPQPNNNTIIDECSTDSLRKPSQIPLESMIETQESITPPIEPFLNTTNKLSKKRKVRMVKGGMVERLTKCLSKTKSNLSFWQHHRSIELIKPGTLVTIGHVEKTYGRILLHTKVNNEAAILCLCSGSLEVKRGDIIEVELENCQSYKTDTHVLYTYVDQVLQIK